MSALPVALAHYRRRIRAVRAVERMAVALWRRVDRSDISRSWLSLLPQLLLALRSAQTAEAEAAAPYLAAVLAAQGLPVPDMPGLNIAGFVGVASDGRDLASLLAHPALTAKSALRLGRPLNRAMAAGHASLQLITSTQVADAGRVADQVALVAAGRAGYVRMVVGDTCSRCIVLAGRWYEWSEGFDRHPKCDCVHIPASEDAAGDLRTDPRAYFDSLSEADQDRIFTKAGAQAIRDGADIGRVVNARRAAAGLTPAAGRLTEDEKRQARRRLERGRLQPTRVFGRDLFLTAEATTSRGINRRVRLMPESIYELADGDRGEALRLLRVHGYLLGEPSRRGRASLEQDVPAAAQPFHRDINGVEDLAASVQRVTGDTPRVKLAGGQSATTQLVTLPDGRRLVTKRGEDWGDPQEVAVSMRQQADAEQLASLLGRTVGAPVARVYRQDADRIWMEWIDGTVAGDLPGQELDELVRGRDGQLLGLLDMLSGNADRNGGNMIFSDGRLVGIDHGWAWGGELGQLVPGLHGYPSSNFADEFGLVDNPLTLRDVTVLHARLDGLRPHFEHVGRGDWLDAAQRMLDQLEGFARGTVDLIA